MNERSTIVLKPNLYLQRFAPNLDDKDYIMISQSSGVIFLEALKKLYALTKFKQLPLEKIIQTGQYCIDVIRTPELKINYVSKDRTGLDIEDPSGHIPSLALITISHSIIEALSTHSINEKFIKSQNDIALVKILRALASERLDA